MDQDQLINFFQRALQPLKDRIYMIASRAIITKVKDGEKIQQVQLQVLSDESLDDVQRLQNFGFSSNPPVGTEGIMLSLGGSRNNSVIIATDHRNFRIKSLQSGESVMYTDDGTYIILKRNGQVEVKAATLLTIDVPDTLIKGNVTINENLLVKGETVLEDTLLVKENATFEKSVAVTLNQTIGGNLEVTGVIAASGFTGPSGGAAVLTVDIQTSGNVTGGGTSLAAIKAGFNAHTHVETGTTTATPGTSL